MLEKIMVFIANHFTPLCTLLATIIGGLISYISTSFAENRRNKDQLKKEKLVDILIPYCTLIENTVELATSVYSDSFSLSIEDLFKQLKQPLVYLKAEKRVYLSNKQVTNLERYNELINKTYYELEKDFESTYISYVHWLSTQIYDFPKVPTPMHITMSFSDYGKRQLYFSIIRKCDCSIIGFLRSVDYIKNDDPDNYRSTTINITDHIKESYGAISYGLIDIDDIDNDEEMLGCIFLDYISDIKDRDILEQIIDNTYSSFNMRAVVDLLQEINKDVIKEIDKITR